MGRQTTNGLEQVKEQSRELVGQVREMSKSGALAAGTRSPSGRRALLAHLDGIKADCAALSASLCALGEAAKIIEEALGNDSFE